MDLVIIKIPSDIAKRKQHDTRVYNENGAIKDPSQDTYILALPLISTSSNTKFRIKVLIILELRSNSIVVDLNLVSSMNHTNIKERNKC